MAADVADAPRSKVQTGSGVGGRLSGSIPVGASVSPGAAQRLATTTIAGLESAIANPDEHRYVPGCPAFGITGRTRNVVNVVPSRWPFSSMRSSLYTPSFR
jgi:hypothetical protein